MEHRHGREGGCWARSRRRHEAGGKGYAGGKGEIRRGEDASHLAISKCFGRAKLEHVQEFAIFYLAYLVFCQLLKRYAK